MYVVKHELLDRLGVGSQNELYDILIVKTGICYKRYPSDYCDKNIGFSSDIIVSSFRIDRGDGIPVTVMSKDS